MDENSPLFQTSDDIKRFTAVRTNKHSVLSTLFTRSLLYVSYACFPFFFIVPTALVIHAERCGLHDRARDLSFLFPGHQDVSMIPFFSRFSCFFAVIFFFFHVHFVPSRVFFLTGWFGSV